ncbi:hypothetical protein RhiXN_06390 [Rhizoctonia solani]|uniref:Uncharacterized protein n=1 Tax=Rhizoctonia solani TaxID=456999 RepID=A0A8H8SWU9_9AGAM|nr:uncharacterized protein RhiXN_06390 [Rhizoctonia solani]QRW21401.1 hypothetical protein RhiXN_06390 [Rhizoctonia solani]
MQTRRCPPSVESRFCHRLKFRPSLRVSISTSQTPVCLPSPSRTTVALDTAISDTVSLIDEDFKATLYIYQKMLHLNLARTTRPVFDTSYSPTNHPSARRRTIARALPLPTAAAPVPGTHPTDLAASAAIFRRPSRNGNEEVLRSRLEGVLSSASTSRDASCPPSPHRRRATTSGDISTTFGLMTPPHGPLPPVPSMTRSRTSPAISRSSPITPPPSPPFDAKRIALQLRDREGYVSFADVQGLGIPSEELDTPDTDRSRAKWWSLWKG